MLLVEHLQSQLVVSGHMHRRYRRQFTWQNGKETLFAALAHIEMGVPSIAVFSDSGGEMNCEYELESA